MKRYSVQKATYSSAVRAHSLCARAIHEISIAGLGEAVLDDSATVLWVESSGGEPIGVLAYTGSEWGANIWVELGYTVPDRHQGVYAALFARLYRIAGRQEAGLIGCGIHETNELSLKTHLAIGCHLRPYPDEPFLEATLSRE